MFTYTLSKETDEEMRKIWQHRRLHNARALLMTPQLRGLQLLVSAVSHSSKYLGTLEQKN